MISRVFPTGKTFGETCKYLLQDQTRAQLLAVEGVRGHDYHLMEKDFDLQHQFTPEKEKPVFHGVLSFPQGGDPGDEKIVEIARKYLQEIGMVHTQYAMVKHIDKAHLHLHILANKVDNDGKIIKEGLIIRRSIKTAEKLTREYKLQPETGKNLSKMNWEALPEHEAKFYRLYEIIKERLPGCRRIEDLEKRLSERGIETRYRIDARSHERVGISFRFENISFKGSQFGEDYFLKGLERTLV